MEEVQRKVGPQRIGGGPANAFAEVRRSNEQRLLQDRSGEEEQRESYEEVQRRLRSRRIDERAENERAGHLERNAAEQEELGYLAMS
jgi:hypothetical protein